MQSNSDYTFITTMDNKMPPNTLTSNVSNDNKEVRTNVSNDDKIQSNVNVNNVTKLFQDLTHEELRQIQDELANKLRDISRVENDILNCAQLNVVQVICFEHNDVTHYLLNDYSWSTFIANFNSNTYKEIIAYLEKYNEGKYTCITRAHNMKEFYLYEYGYV